MRPKLEYNLEVRTKFWKLQQQKWSDRDKAERLVVVKNVLFIIKYHEKRKQ